jgi:selenium-binding protein 1
VSDPQQPKPMHQSVIGRQPNMVTQSRDGERLYFTSSLLANWDKKGEDNEQFLKGYRWDGKELKPSFAIDFAKAKIGRPHMMTFGSTKLYD